MKAWTEILNDLLDAIEPGPGGRSKAERTKCCSVLMWDLWQHAPNCPGEGHVRSPSDPRSK